jgi:predicted O-linked N-acetylglucosamine transferase (SPINDLY family)
LHELGRAEEAIESYDRALELRPQYPAALYNRGLALHRLKRFTDALASYDSALEIKPDYFEVYNNRGNTLQELRRTSDALNSYQHALRLNPLSAEAHCNQGSVLHDLRRCEEALQCYARALELRPDFAEAHHNRGNTLRELKRFAEAAESYARTLQLRSEHRWAYGNWLHTKRRECRWNELPAQITGLLDKVEQGQPVSLPLFVLALTDSPVRQRRAAEIWVRETCPPTITQPGVRRRERGAKIRLGYYSADFHSHATAHLTAGLFEEHDRERFELLAFSFGAQALQDPMRKRLSEAFKEFVDVRTMSDVEVTHLSRKLEIDIAVDLKGFTLHERTRIFAQRAAPVQVSYLGYPGTMGAPYIDYLVADPVLIPAGSRQYYAEKIAYLPHSYQVNDRQRPIAERSFARAELGLPEQGLVFCCFNNSYKITPETFTSWMHILASVPGSVLWLLEDSPGATENLRHEAQARGVDADRLVFAGRMPLPEHLARHRVADLFLDNLPYNAHTTASDALWAGLPVLTCLGESFAGRVAGSLLTAVGLPELVTTTTEQYEALAIGLATQPQRLDALRTRLAENRLRAPLFDTALFTRHLENAYLQMYERHQQGLPPEHLFVEP